MVVNEKDLRNAGFSEQDIENLKRRRSHEGGSLAEIISALSCRFRVSVWITILLIFVMSVVLICGNSTHIISGGVGVVIALAIIWTTFSVSLGIKASRLQKNKSAKKEGR
ncbi:hypothetical protein HF650_05160 [Kosakonia sp. SMBL-WEM22]|uniref:hypothetical protein n=1 Tax=Kosakonia sp. SMBL-WEM22 TaxID=2725560 RepID=UPI001659A2F9|nr:hypothetical protein [Kosakonia sp. SMBL-WEM22]QNQ19182.1 hypothetical protein HF650_05160 [Kosakonia sp. SMBL-WEM22]